MSNTFLKILRFQIAAPETPLPHPECPQVDDINNPKLLPFPGDCTKYYSCMNGLAYPQKCPGIFHWSRLASRCEYPEKAMCPWQLVEATMPITAATLPIVATPSPVAASISDSVYHLYPNDCNRYYKCEAVACPNNYHWNYQKQQCDFPHLAHCPFRPTTPVIPTAPTAPPTAATAPPTAATASPTALPTGTTEACIECTHWCLGQGHIYLPYPGDCRKFIQCNGLAFIHNCPNDLLWNDKLKTCDRFCIVNDV